MRIFFVPSSRLAPGRYLAHGIHWPQGERYLGVVWRVGDKKWRNDRDRVDYATRGEAAAVLL